MLCCGIFTVHTAFALLVGMGIWDDGYITLASARTFAETGRIAVTPVSETVEAATSPMWFLIMAGVHRLGITGMYSFHLAAQLLAGCCAAVGVVLFYRLIRPTAPAYAWQISLTVFLAAAFITETVNGMEMTLLVDVVLAIAVGLRDQGDQEAWPSVSLVLLAAAIPWIRIECGAYALLGFLGIWWLSRRRRSAIALAASVLSSLALLTATRFLIFGSVLPNSILAKRWPPYMPDFDPHNPSMMVAWTANAAGRLILPLYVLVPSALIFGLALRLTGRRLRETLSEQRSLAKNREWGAALSFSLAYSLGVVGFDVFVSPNIANPAGRMELCAIPLLIASALMIAPVTGSRRPLAARSKAAVVGVLAILIPGFFPCQYGTALVLEYSPDKRIHDIMAIVPRFGTSIEHVRQLLGLPKIRAIFGDIGYPSFCCEKIEVLDAAMLASRELAEHGPSRLPEYLREQDADIITAYPGFGALVGIFSIPYLRERYTPIVIEEVLYYLRNDHYRALSSSCQKTGVGEVSPLYAKPFSGPPADLEYIHNLGLSQLCGLR
jgi:hypothetical protein